MESIWTFHQQNAGRFVGPQAAQARPGWQCLCEVVRSLGNPLDCWLWWHDLSSQNFLRHDLWLYYSFLSIPIPSFVCPKLTCIELLISLHNDRHLFADRFVTVGPIATKFGWGSKTYVDWGRARHLFFPQLGSRTTIKQYRLVRNRKILGHDYIFVAMKKIQKSGRNLIICIFILISRFTRSGVVYFCPFWHHRYQEYIQGI